MFSGFEIGPFQRVPSNLGVSHDAFGGCVCDDGWVGSTVLIVDDREVFRASARELLEAEGFVVVAEAARGTAALEAVVAFRPEIALLDIQLPDIDGLVVAERLADALHPPAVVLISSREATSYGPRLLQSSAHGFILKSALSGKAITFRAG